MNSMKLMLGVTMLTLCIFASNAQAGASSVWSKLTPWHGDVETKEERSGRLATIDIAIDRAVERATTRDKKTGKPRWRGTKEDLRWILIGQAHFETHLARHVHADQCGKVPESIKGECDNGNAKSLWQIQKTSNALSGAGWWESLGGADQEATDRAAWAATVILSRTYNRCRSISGAISMYATGKTCFWEDGPKRARWIKKARAHYAARFAH